MKIMKIYQKESRVNNKRYKLSIVSEGSRVNNNRYKLSIVSEGSGVNNNRYKLSIVSEDSGVNNNRYKLSIVSEGSGVNNNRYKLSIVSVYSWICFIVGPNDLTWPDLTSLTYKIWISFTLQTYTKPYSIILDHINLDAVDSNYKISKNSFWSNGKKYLESTVSVRFNKEVNLENTVSVRFNKEVMILFKP